MNTFDEKEAVKLFTKEAQGAAKGFLELTALRAGSPDIVKRLEEGLRSLPAHEHLGSAISGLRNRGEDLLAKLKKARVADFQVAEVAFVNALRHAGKVCREVEKGWRVDRFQLEVDRSSAKARLLLNRVPLTEWEHVSSPSDLETLLNGGDEKLSAAEVPAALFAEGLSNAFLRLSTTAGTRVSLRDLYPETRLELLRSELATGRPDRKLRYADFPWWTYLYNLDLYRRTSQSIPADRRIIFETGSQHDGDRGLLLVLNGLDPGEEYRTYCWASLAPRIPR